MTGPIGHVGPNLPLALLRATGRHAGALGFDPDAPTPRADRWIESKFAPWARSLVQAWSDGAYDSLGQVVFSRADDTAQRVYYYLCELQRRGLIGGPEPVILDIAKIPRAASLRRTELALRTLAERLGATADGIRAVAYEPATPPPGAGQRCLLYGTPPPDRRLHAIIEQAGFTAIGPTLRETWEAAEPAWQNPDPFAGLAQALHADPRGPRAFAEPGARIAAAIEASGADAVVLWQTEDDEAQAWHLPAQRRALAVAGVPALVLTRRDWLARDGAGDEIAAFLTDQPR